MEYRKEFSGQHFYGTCNEVQSQKPFNCVSISDGIGGGALVSIKVKNKIWANDYVNLEVCCPIMSASVGG